MPSLEIALGVVLGGVVVMILHLLYTWYKDRHRPREVAMADYATGLFEAIVPDLAGKRDSKGRTIADHIHTLTKAIMKPSEEHSTPTMGTQCSVPTPVSQNTPYSGRLRTLMDKLKEQKQAEVDRLGQLDKLDPSMLAPLESILECFGVPETIAPTEMASDKTD